MVEESLWRWEGIKNDGGSNGCGYFDLTVKIRGDESAMDELEGGYENRTDVWEVVENLGADADGGDVGGGIMSHDVLRHPVGGGGVWLADSEELFVGNGDGDFDSGAGEGNKHTSIGVV